MSNPIGPSRRTGSLRNLLAGQCPGWSGAFLPRNVDTRPFKLPNRISTIPGH